jgi:hypothetical protein
MKTIEEIRHVRLLQLLESPEYPSAGALAKAIGKSPAQVSQWKNRSRRSDGGVANIDSESARNIERSTGKPRGWMDNEVSTGLMTMGTMVAQWIDHRLQGEKRLKAYWIMQMMVEHDVWPDMPTEWEPRIAIPSREPSAERAPSSNP